MENILQYSLNHKLKIIYIRINGEVLFNELIDAVRAKLKESNYNVSYSILADIRDTNFEVSKIKKVFECNILKEIVAKINMKRKCAVLTYKPNEVAFSMIFKTKMEQFSPMNIKVFSTKESAMFWLN